MLKTLGALAAVGLLVIVSSAASAGGYSNRGHHSYYGHHGHSGYRGGSYGSGPYTYPFQGRGYYQPPSSAYRGYSTNRPTYNYGPGYGGDGNGSFPAYGAYGVPSPGLGVRLYLGR